MLASPAKKCSHATKETCKSTDGCVWILDKGCRVKDNVPLAILSTNKKKEALLVKIVGKVKAAPQKTAQPKKKQNAQK